MLVLPAPVALIGTRVALASLAPPIVISPTIPTAAAKTSFQCHWHSGFLDQSSCCFIATDDPKP